jgi:hypothetical protein
MVILKSLNESIKNKSNCLGVYEVNGDVLKPIIIDASFKQAPTLCDII